MVTTRRSFDTVCEETNNSNVGVLEKKTPDNYSEFVGNTSSQKVEDLTEAKVRMQKNLEKLLNYEKYSNAVEEQEEKESVVEDNLTAEKVDVEPTSTTMQFGSVDVESMLNDLRNEKTFEKKERSNKASIKGKIIVAFYSLAVAVIFALIVINTGVLAILEKENTDRKDELNGVVKEYTSVMDDISKATSDSNVINLAEEYGMNR